ncbi:MAG TPA: glycerophosphodiester phosphodiesterase [Chitinophagaceae bacterium]|nr:glycerophosphodiester phosphodiesterase [Chitinophagaceae bacterium]
MWIKNPYFIVCAIVLTYNSSMAQEKRFDIQGHRGCRGLMPENTIPAMLKALDIGVTTLEMDVVITKDKQVVLSHEPFFNHEISTKPDGSLVSDGEEKNFNIYQMSYAEVRKWDVGSRPHPRFPDQQKLKVYKPLLGELIDSVEKYLKEKKLRPVYYNIETKSLPIGDSVFHPLPDEFVELLMSVIKAKKIEDRVIIQSFDFRTLQIIHQKYPGIKIAALVEGSDSFFPEKEIKKLGFIPTIYSPYYLLVNESLVNYCHDNNIKLIPWTVNSISDARRLVNMGVDGIISDYPNIMIKEFITQNN